MLKLTISTCGGHRAGQASGAWVSLALLELLSATLQQTWAFCAEHRSSMWCALHARAILCMCVMHRAAQVAGACMAQVVTLYWPLPVTSINLVSKRKVPLETLKPACSSHSPSSCKHCLDLPACLADANALLMRLDREKQCPLGYNEIATGNASQSKPMALAAPSRPAMPTHLQGFVAIVQESAE
jgi:hypothetical protein